jgi:uncharacterized protein (UPF0264 family)
VQLLISVANVEEARAALEGGADLIDAKDPASGALGAVPLDVLRRITATVNGARPVTAALGDANHESTIERLAGAYAAAGATLVKVGFLGVSDDGRVGSLLMAAVRGASAAGAGVVAVAYADADRACIDADALVRMAARMGARGVLLDTTRKDGPGLRALLTPRALASWVALAHEAGLLVALAGKLTIEDLAFVCDAGADIAGVRGAACHGGRTGRVVTETVRQITQAVRRSTHARVPGPGAACG